MIGNNRHSDRTFVSEHICGRLAPSAGHADARLLSLVLPLSPSRAASLFRSLSISFRLSFLAYLLSFSSPGLSFRSLAHARPVPVLSLSVSSRARRSSLVLPRPSSLLSSLVSVRIGTSSALLASLFLFRAASLSAAAVYNHPLAVRSLARSLGPHRIRLPLCPAPPRASLHSSRSRPPPFPTLRLCLYPLRNRSLYFSSLSFSISLLFSRHLFRSSRPVFFLRPMLFRPTFMYRLVCLVCRTYIIQPYVCVRVRVRVHPPGRPSRAHRSRCAGDARVRIASIRVYGGKKWADVSSALVTAACKYAATEGARTRHACTGSVEELLPFLSASFLYRPGFSNIFARYPLRRRI